MTETEGHLGQFAVISRLFALIDDLPREKQFILLKQLLGDRLPVHLMRMVLDMNDMRRLELLRALEQPLEEEGPVTTIRLDDSDHLMRGVLRKPCRIPVRFKIDEAVHRSVVVDIGMEGVFIQSDDRPEKGKAVLLQLALPGSAESLTLAGVVARSGAGGFGVQFKGLDSLQHEKIARFVGAPGASSG